MISKNSWENGSLIKRTGAEASGYGASAFNSVLSSSDGSVYFAADSGTMFLSFDPDLKLKWKKDLGGRVSGSPAEDKDGNIYAAAFVAEKEFNEQNEYVSDRYIYRLFSFYPDGALRWQKDLDAGIMASCQKGIFTPAIGDTAGYIAAKNNLYSFDLETGEIIWTYSIENEAGQNYYGGSPSLASDGAVYAVFSDGYFYALNSDGAEKWSYQNAS